MAQDKDHQQEALKQFYNLQQQFLDGFRQFMQPPAAANPMEQMWRQWSGGATGQANPYAALQNPMMQWMQSGMGPMNDLYRQMNESLVKQFGASFSPLPGMTQPFAGFDPSGMEQFNQLFPADQREHAESLMKTLADYQHLSIEMSQLMANLAQNSIEQLREQVTAQSEPNPEQLAQRWSEISGKVLQDAMQSDDFKSLQEKYSEIQQRLAEDTNNYRQTLAEQLGLVTHESYELLQQQVETLTRQVEALSTGAADAVTRAQDDFTVLKGIGQKLNEQLHDQGVKNIEQLASMSDDMLKNLDQDLQAKGRVFQDQWREQAEQFLNSMTGKTDKK